MEAILSQCIDSCEKCIDAAQKLIGMCSASNGTECAKSVGIIAGRAEQCIADSKECIKHCRKMLEKANNGQRKMIEWAITKSSDCIKHCQKAIEECKDGKVSCIKDCELLIQACKDSADACNRLLNELD